MTKKQALAPRRKTERVRLAAKKQQAGSRQTADAAGTRLTIYVFCYLKVVAQVIDGRNMIYNYAMITSTCRSMVTT